MNHGFCFQDNTGWDVQLQKNPKGESEDQLGGCLDHTKSVTFIESVHPSSVTCRLSEFDAERTEVSIVIPTHL